MSSASSNMGDFLSNNLQNSDSNIPEEHDSMMTTDEQVSVFPPPPHIAARFYRRSQQRRRSSAASSRRNSMSSAHSHHSHHSHHSYHGSQSNHVAQHLRRASILESRKARLADRAAHAEQVRLRAALAKAAPRVTMSEERALAAEKTRQRYLAQVASACSEEVKRAKRVAEEMKERREAEGRKLRSEIEERLAEAERRRFEYQRNLKRGRTASTPRMEETRALKDSLVMANEKEAALIIQHAWRVAKRRKIVRGFLDLGLSIERVRNTDFEEVGALLSQEKILVQTAELLRLCGVQDQEGHIVGEKSTVRTFLSAFLILGHSAQVLSQDGEQERDLVTKAKELFISFEHLLLRFTPLNNFTLPPAQRQRFLNSYNAFLSAFTAWKAHDSTVLLQAMLAQYVELDAIWQTIKTDSEEVVKAEYREGIRENQILLLVRIKRLAGPDKAKELIRGAIRKARRDRQKKGVDVTTASSAQAAAAGSTPSNTVSAPSQPLAAQHPELPLGQVDVPYASQEANRLAKVMSVMPENRVLAHELAINKHYSLDANTIIDTDTRRAIRGAVFDSMRAGIQKGDGQKWIVAMAETIRARLLRLLTPGNSLHVLISEALDPAVIARECSMGGFSYDRFFSFMFSLLPKLCAPFRDPDVKALADYQGADFIDRLDALLRVIDLISIDYANYLLQQSTPQLITEAPAYEEACFQKDLDNGNLTLRGAIKWWSDAREKVFTEANKRDPEGINLPSKRPTSQKIYLQGLTDLFISISELSEEDFPETFVLDKERILRIRSDTTRVIAIGSILLTAKNLLKRDVRTQWKTEAARMWEILKDDNYAPSAAANIQSLIESSYALPPPTKTQLSSLILRVMSQSQSRQITDPLMRLLLHRMKSYVFIRLVASNASDRVRTTSTANEGLAASVLPEFIGRIGEIVDEIAKVGHVDRASHGRWYEQIASDADREEART